MQATNRQRPAFSLIELLVVVAIVAIVCGLVIAAVQRARETGNRAVCANNLRQIGLAMHMHHNVYRVFPSNGGWNGSQTILSVTGEPVTIQSYDAFVDRTFPWGVGQPDLSPQEQTGSWAYAMLPYIDQEPLYLACNWTLPVALYNCPSRRPPASFVPVDDEYGDYSGGGWAWGNTDYGGNAYVVANRPDCLALVDMTDGTSNTMLIGEKALSPLIYNLRSSWYWDEPFFSGGAGGTQRGRGPIASDGTSIVQDSPNMGFAFRFNWGAAHPAGAQFLFADGSVRLLAFATPAATVVALMTPAGGEVLPSF